jgi:hypothetical protein
MSANTVFSIPLGSLPHRPNVPRQTRIMINQNEEPFIQSMKHIPKRLLAIM